MPETRKVLGQAAPGAVLTNLYTVPAGTQAVVSTIVAANRSAAEKTIRVSVAVAGAVDAVQQYLAYDAPVGANDMVALTLGLTLGAGDVIRVYGSTADVSFAAFGVEVS